MSIKEEINKMLDDICGEPLEESHQEPRAREKLEESLKKLERSKVNVLEFFKECYGMGLADYQREFIESLEREVEYRSRWHKNKIDCRCGTVYTITIEDNRECLKMGKYRGSWIDEMLLPISTDNFYCFKCGVPIYTYGSIKKVTSDDSKFGFIRG